MNKLFLILVCLLITTTSCTSQEITVIEATPGGVYELPKLIDNQTYVINGSGDVDHPFVFKGDSTGTVLKGCSAIKVNASYVYLKDLHFLNNEITYKQNKALIDIDKKKSGVHDVTISNCKFEHSVPFNDRDSDSQFYWIYVNANQVRITQNSFEGKKNRLPIIHVQSKNRKTIINNNFFGNVAPRKGEALEAVRIGLGDGPAECTLASNTFFKYHGDSETVSVKADKVRLVNNQFIYCRSGISLRGSDNSIVEENVFSYANTPLRISGKGHKIFDNIFKGNTGPDIVLMTGGPNYNPVSNNEIFNNYFYDQFNVGLLTYQNYDIMPDHISLHDNYVIGNSINSPLQDVTFLKSSFSKKSITEVRVSKDFTLKEMIFK